MKISDIFPKKLDFVRYLGSLTTGNCEETVLWNIFLRPLKISADQVCTELNCTNFDNSNENNNISFCMLKMAAFRRLSNKTGSFVVNYRQTYPLNGRSLQFLRAKGVFRDKSNEQYTTLGQYVFNFPGIVASRIFNFIKTFINL